MKYLLILHLIRSQPSFDDNGENYFNTVMNDDYKKYHALASPGGIGINEYI